MTDKEKAYVSQFLAEKNLPLAAAVSGEIMGMKKMPHGTLVEYTESLILHSAQQKVLLNAAIKSLAPYIGNGENELDRALNFKPKDT